MKPRYIIIPAILLCVIYISLIILPYTGSAYVSEETKDMFSLDHFYGEGEIPERVMLLENPRDSFYHRVNLISNAQEQILFASYGIFGGTAGDIVIGALLAAADRGVSVIIINDALIGAMPSKYRNVLAVHDNIDIYKFNKFELFRPQYINSVFHDKYMTVDDKYMIMGGRNIDDRHYDLEGFEGRLAFDREVLVYNSDMEYNGSIAEVREYFFRKINSDRATLVNRANRNRNWETQKNDFISLYTEYKEGLAIGSFDYQSNTVSVNSITLITNPFDTAKKESIVAYNLMMLAKNSDVIVAQSPYVVLTNRELAILADIADNKEFTLLTNSLASTPNLPSFSSYHVNRMNILNTGITIYEYQDTQSSIHAKTYLFDGRLTAIGSFNMNQRSIRSDTESMLIIDSVEFHDITLEAVSDQISKSLRVAADNTYVFSDDVEEAKASWAKRALYTTAGYAFWVFRFMF